MLGNMAHTKVFKTTFVMTAIPNSPAQMPYRTAGYHPNTLPVRLMSITAVYRSMTLKTTLRR